MAWRWLPRDTPKSSAPHPRPHRLGASTRLTIAIAVALMVAALALFAWYRQ